MIVFITGATAGFGRQMAKVFASEGHLVVASGRRLDKLEELAAACGENVHVASMDVTDLEEVKKAIAGLPSKFAGIDVLINNAGLALGMDPAQKASASDWNTMVDVNVKGVLHCTHAILPGMVARNKGHIVNLGSVAGEFPYPNGNVYGATKAFVHQFSLNLRADLVGTGVRVTCVEPGLCGGTEFSEVRFKGDKKRAEAVYAGVKSLSAADIAETVRWVVSLPPHVNINVISMMPVQQAFSAFAVSRNAPPTK